MSQTVIQIGNSLGVTLPKEFVKKHDLKKGSLVSVAHSNGSITFSSHIPLPSSYEPISDPDLNAAIREVELRYGEALDQLAKLQ